MNEDLKDKLTKEFEATKKIAHLSPILEILEAILQLNEKIQDIEKLLNDGVTPLINAATQKATLEFDLDYYDAKASLSYMLKASAMQGAIEQFKNDLHYKYKHKELTDEASHLLAEIKEMYYDEFNEFYD